MLGEFVVALADLVEVEARAARSGIVALWGALALLSAAALFGVAGLGMFLWAVYLTMLYLLPPPAAALLVGLLSLAAALGLLFVALQLTR